MTSTLFPPQPPPAVSDIMDAGFRLYRLTVLPNLLFSLPMVLAAQAPNIYRLSHAGRDPVWWALASAGPALSLWFWAALVLRQAAAARGERLAANVAVTRAAACVPALLALAIISIAGIALGLVLLIVPGLLASLVTLFAPYALLLETRAPAAACRQVWQRLRGQIGAAIATVSMTLAIFLVFYIVFAVLGVMVAQGQHGNELLQQRYSVAAGCLAQILFAPMFTASLLALHLARLSSKLNEA